MAPVSPQLSAPRPSDLGGGARSNGGETTGVQLFGATTTHSLPRVGLHEGNDIANYMGSYSPRIGAARAAIHGKGGRGGATAENSHGLRSPSSDCAHVWFQHEPTKPPLPRLRYNSHYRSLFAVAAKNMKAAVFLPHREFGGFCTMLWTMGGGRVL